MLYRSRETRNLDPRNVARALNGDVHGNHVSAPGPGHSIHDRSLSVLLAPGAPDGFTVNSFAGDDWRACRDHVSQALGLDAWQPAQGKPAPCAPTRAVASNGDSNNAVLALRLWREAGDPRATNVSAYLASRSLSISDGIAGDVIRFHPKLKFENTPTSGMLALFRDIAGNEPCGIHRTFLNDSGHKLGRKMLGRAKGAAIKLDADEAVTFGLFIGEGLETCLAARLAGFRPVWALGSAHGIAAFPVLAGIDAITILAEVNDGGVNCRAARACAARWIQAGRDVFMVSPLIGDDLNDVWRGVAP